MWEYRWENKDDSEVYGPFTSQQMQVLSYKNLDHKAVPEFVGDAVYCNGNSGLLKKKAPFIYFIYLSFLCFFSSSCQCIFFSMYVFSSVVKCYKKNLYKKKKSWKGLPGIRLIGWQRFYYYHFYVSTGSGRM